MDMGRGDKINVLFIGDVLNRCSLSSHFQCMFVGKVVNQIVDVAIWFKPVLENCKC